MINLSGLNQNVAFVLGLILVSVYCWMLTDRVSKRIRNSKVWVVGWLGGLMILSMGAKLMMPVLNQILDGTGLDDETLVPTLLFGVLLVTGIVLCVQLYKLRLLRKG